MKLIYCKECGDIVRLIMQFRYCDCGFSGGGYTDAFNVTVWGAAVPLGIHNFSLREAIKERPKEGKGGSFTAFVIPEDCDTVKKV